jgi:hypothetical protein
LSKLCDWWSQPGGANSFTAAPSRPHPVEWIHEEKANGNWEESEHLNGIKQGEAGCGHQQYQSGRGQNPGSIACANFRRIRGCYCRTGDQACRCGCYSLNWVGRYHLQGATLLGNSVLPTIAYSISKWLSVGVGFNVMIGYLKEKVAINNLPTLPDGQLGTRLSAPVRLLAEELRGVLWHGRRVGDRNGVSVRHQLERACREDRLNSGAPGLSPAARRRRREGVLFAMAVVVVVFTLLMFPASFWLHTIPYTVTVWEAAALPQSLKFQFWGDGLVVFLVVLIYTGAVFWIFRGKLGRSHMG